MFIRSQLKSPPAYLKRVDSPLGRIEIASDGDAITSLSIERDGTLPFDDVRFDGVGSDRVGSDRVGSDRIAENDSPLLTLAATQLAEYFDGKRHTFELPVKLSGTEFQSEIWEQLSLIGWGEVRSYGELGVASGRATAGRAVGGAVGANPIPIIIPCHRVLATNRRITGYSGGNGIPTKIWLLDHEGIEHVA
jgi:methylated-DNA-[protein]-cysteine S-methyltransferase